MKSRPFHSQSKLLAVARDAGLGMDDGLAPACEAVDERRLAHVRKADHGDCAACGSWPGLAVGRARRSARRPRRRETPVVSTSTESSAARKRPVLALSVAAVPFREIAKHLVDGLPALGSSPARPLLVVGDQKDLERRVGADDGADVPPLGHVRARVRSSRAGASPLPRAPRDARRRETRAPRSRASGSPRRRPGSRGVRARRRTRSRSRSQRPRPGEGHRDLPRPGSTARATQRYIAPESR